jgi:hypothetical protein
MIPRPAPIDREAKGAHAERSSSAHPYPVWRFTSLQQNGVRFAESEQIPLTIGFGRVGEHWPVYKPLRRQRFFRTGQRTRSCPQASKLIRPSSFLTVGS